jgi:hypothetical protein
VAAVVTRSANNAMLSPVLGTRVSVEPRFSRGGDVFTFN